MEKSIVPFSHDFSSYINEKKTHYEKLSKFNIADQHISQRFIIDAKLLMNVRTNFKELIERRVAGEKISIPENRKHKDTLKKLIPGIDGLFDHKGPALYWFQIDKMTGYDFDRILNTYNSKKGNEKGWWAKTNKADIKTTFLYLGKVENAFDIRFMAHIGLMHNYTSSLKLERWMPELPNMKLIFQFVLLEPDWRGHMDDIERVLWHNATPLLGKAPNRQGIT